MQAGEEFGRTKLGDGNSYCSGTELNMLKWRQTVEFADLVEYYKGLISLRKRLPGLCDKSSSAAKRIRNKKILRKGVVSFQVDNRNSLGAVEWDELYVIYNLSESEYIMMLDDGVWQILADAKEADCRKEVTEINRGIKVAAHSGMMLGRISRN